MKIKAKDIFILLIAGYVGSVIGGTVKLFVTDSFSLNNFIGVVIPEIWEIIGCMLGILAVLGLRYLYYRSRE